MATDYSEIVVILDRSGSMQSAKADHEGGLRSFVKDQQELAGDVRFTLIQFDSHNPCEVVYDGVPIADVKTIDLVPRGGTPLLDAIGQAASHVEKRLNESAKNGKWPDQIVVMVITDGEENSSREWNKARIAERVKELEGKAWKFLYLGANVDAFSEAGNIGIVQDCALDFANNHAAVGNVYRALSANTSKSRHKIQEVKTSGGIVCPQAVYANYAYSDEQRVSAMAQPEQQLAENQGAKQWKSTS